MKKAGILILLMGCMILLSACSIRKDNSKKLRDIDFTVVDTLDAPEELLDEIENRKEKTFELTYADEGYLYVARGYGAQDTSGYSVEVLSCYEAENTICVETELLGPPKDEEIIEKETYPNVIIKMEYSEKNVVFD